MIYVANLFLFVFSAAALSFWFLEIDSLKSRSMVLPLMVVGLLLFFGSVLTIYFRIKHGDEHLLKLPSFIAALGLALFAPVFKR